MNRAEAQADTGGTRPEPKEGSVTGDVSLGWYEGQDGCRWVTTAMGAKGVRSVDGPSGARGACDGAGVGTTMKDHRTNAVADPNVAGVGRRGGQSCGPGADGRGGRVHATSTCDRGEG